MVGSLTKRGDNTWFLQVSGGFNANGKRIRHSKTFKESIREAEKELAKFVTEVTNA